MRIEKVKLRNYRQFRNMDINFPKSTKRDLHLIIANNGTGKTNFLNAINWCLYGVEPHLSKDSQQLPRLNLNTILEAEDGSEQEMTVELTTETEGNRIVFTRTEDYVVHTHSRPVLRNISFQVIFLDEKKNAKMVTNEDARSYVERFVPQDIREFFFFDGERLDTYFRSETAAQISHAVFQISQIDTLDRIAERMETVINDWKKEAGRQNPRLESIRQGLEAREKNFKELIGQIAKLQAQRGEARQGYEELNGRLRNIPDIEKLQAEREKLKAKEKATIEVRNEKLRSKATFLFDYAIRIKLFPSLQKAAAMIQTKIDNREIPQTYDTRLLDSILESRSCICGREISENSHEQVRISNLRKEIRVSSAVAQELMKMQSPLDELRSSLPSFRTRLKEITDEIQLFTDQLTEIQAQVNKIDSDIGGYPNVEQVAQWYKELRTYEKIANDNADAIAKLGLQRDQFANEIEAKRSEEKRELARLDKFEETRRYIDFGMSAFTTITDVKNKMMSSTRFEIQKETKELFLSLIWKKGTFKDVVIDSDYTLHLMHSLGYECLGTLAASERQLLALSFLLALHRVSGFDSPIIVDTPVARVSGEQRENLGKVFSQVGLNKQIVLLFLPSEYSTEISKTLDNDTSSMRRFRLTGDEREVKMEVLKECLTDST